MEQLHVDKLGRQVGRHRSPHTDERHTKNMMKFVIVDRRPRCCLGKISQQDDEERKNACKKPCHHNPVGHFFAVDLRDDVCNQEGDRIRDNPD